MINTRAPDGANKKWKATFHVMVLFMQFIAKLHPTFTFFRPNLLENKRHGLDQTLALQYQLPTTKTPFG